MNEYYGLKTAGFTDVEIQADMTKRLKSAGFTDQEANADIFQQSIAPDQQAYDLLNKPNPALLDYFGRSFAKAQDMPAPKLDPYAGQLGGSDAAIVDPAFRPGPRIDVTLEPEVTYGKAIRTGANQSIVGLFMAHLTGQDKAPKSVMGDLGPAEFKPGLTPEQQQDLPQGKRLALQAVQVAGDIPAMALGAVGGAELGPIGSSAGAFAMPAAIRSILMAEYEQGQIQTPTDFITRGAVAMWEASKGAVVGAATYGGATAGKLASPMFQLPAEIVAMTTAGAAVEGHMPKAQDFVDGALLIGAMHGATAIAGPAVRTAQDITPKLREVYAKTGIRPERVIEDIKSDPSIREDLMSQGGEVVPRAYAEVAKTELPPHLVAAAQKWERSMQAQQPRFMERDVTPEGYGPARGETGQVNQTAFNNPEIAKLTSQINEVSTILKGENVKGKAKLRTKLSDMQDRLQELQKDNAPSALEIDKEASYALALGGTTQPVFDPNRPVMPAGAVGADGVTKISDVVKLLEDAVGTPIRTGKLGRGVPMGAVGWFKSGQDLIRTKTANDIGVISHEVGHSLQKVLYGSMDDAALAPWRKELDAIIPGLSAEYKLKEGFAEAVARYIIDPASLSKDAPTFFKAFEERMDTQAPQIKAALLQAQEMVKKWQEQPAIMRVLSHISVGETGKPSMLERATTRQGWSDLYTASIDRLNPLDNLVKEGLKPGEKLPADVDPYKLARVFAGWTGKGNHFLETSPFRFEDYKNVGKALAETLRGVENLDELRAYLISKSALERGDKGILSEGFDVDAKAVVDQLGAKYEPVAREIYEFKNNVLDYMRDAGVISADSVASMREAWQAHVPFYRIMEDAGVQGGAGKSLQARQPIKKAKGSGRDIVDPLESIIKDAYTFINMAERNAVIESIVKFAETHEGLGRYIEKVDNPMTPTKVQTEEIYKSLETKVGMSPGEIKDLFGNIDMGITIFRPDAFLDKSNQIALFRDGKRTVYQVDPRIAEVVHNLDAQGMNTLIRILSVPARMLRVGATSTPEFLLSNTVKDTFSAAVYSQYGFVPAYDTVRGIFNMFKSSDRYHEWQKSGGEHFAMVGMDRDSLQKNLAALTETGALDNVRNIIRHPLEMARAFGEYSEGGTRMGEYIRAREKLGDSKAAMIEAGLSSRDLMDFSRKGSSGAVQAMSQITAFWNARLQGTDKLIRSFKDDPLGTTLRATAIYTVPSVLLAVSNFVSEPQEEQDRVWAKETTGQELTWSENYLYQRMIIRDSPDWMKDIFWQIPAGAAIVRIPKGFELGVLFASVPERATNWILGQMHKNSTGKEFQGLTSSLIGGVLPAVVPTVSIVPMEIWANKSFFTGGKIVPTQREGALPEVQYTPNTTRTMRELSRVIGELPNMRTHTFSPANAEQIIQGWTGGTGRYALQVTDWALRSAGVVPGPPKPDWKISDVPAVKAFVVRYPSAGTQPITDFYENYQKAEQYVKAIGAYQRDFDFKNAANLMQENSFNVLAGAYQAMSQQATAIHNIMDMPDMDGTKKRELIDSIYLQMNMTAKAGNQAYRQVQQVMKTQQEATK